MRFRFAAPILLTTAIIGFGQNLPRLATAPSGNGLSHAPEARAPLPPGCPNYTGPLDSVGVPVGQSVDLVVLSGPAPPGGYTWNVFSDNPSVVAAGNPTQGFIPVLFTPEGQTFSSVFTIFGVALGQANLILEEVSPAFASSSTPVTAWAVNPQGFSDFVDANAPGNSCRTSGTPTLSSDPSVLSSCGADVAGTVTDGVSKLLLRVGSGLVGTACYSVTSTGPPDQGSITTAITTTQSAGGVNYGFSFYQAPAQYGDPSDNRPVSVQFAFVPNIGRANTTTISSSLTVTRPPLLLIHGLWSNQSAWSGGAANWARPGPFSQTYTADYSGTNASNFSTNFPTVQSWVASALQQTRDSGFAATQADVVGHSMGGILTRLYAGSAPNVRNDNYNMGDVHRLVTLDTPHAGASLANLIVSLSANSIVFGVIGSVVTPIASLFDAAGNIDSGAICDLSENSPALVGLNGGTALMSQVVTGTGGPAGTPASPALYFSPVEGALTKQICILGHCVNIFPANVVNGFRFLQQNDQIVSLTSQQALVGGGGSDQTGYIHTAVEKGADVATFTLNLLDGPNSGFLSSLPGVGSNGKGNPSTVAGTGASSDQSDYASQCVGFLAPLQPLFASADKKSQSGGETRDAARKAGQHVRAPTAQAPDSRIQITSPASGQQFAPGNTVALTVQVAAPLTVNTGWVGTNIPGVGSAEGTSYTSNSYTTSFVIPTTFAGPATLTPAILDSNGNPYLGVSVGINVVPTSPPASLSIQQPYTHLTSVPANASIYVTGTYAGGVKLNLTSPVTGTTYTSSNTSVLTVDANGSVHATAFGIAVVTVKNSGLTAFATFVVENAASPLPPQDMTSSLNILQSGFQLNRNTGFYVQTVTVTNSLAVPVAAPMYFLITGLSAGVIATTAGGGLTKNISPTGSPYVKLQVPGGLTLQPGASISITLQFLNPSRSRISYTPKVFRTLGKP